MTESLIDRYVSYTMDSVESDPRYHWWGAVGLISAVCEVFPDEAAVGDFEFESSMRHLSLSPWRELSTRGSAKTQQQDALAQKSFDRPLFRLILRHE